jgi:hypothetical protein
MTYYLTNHAAERLRQRGLRESDVDVVLLHGTQTGEAIVLTRKDADAAIAEHKRQIAQLERLRGMAAFTRDCAVVTLFRPTPEQLRRLMHGARSVRRARRVRRARGRSARRRLDEHVAGEHPWADGGSHDE